MNRWILRCLDFKKTIFSIAIILLIISSFGLRYLQFDFKLDVMKKNEFTQQIAFITIYDPHLLDSQHLQLLAKMHQELSAIKLVEEVTSLYTIPNLRRYLEEHEWHPVLEENYYTSNSLAQVKSDVLENELFVGKFINKQADTMLFYLSVRTDKYGEVELEAREKIQKILDQYQGNFSKIFQTGTPEMIYYFSVGTIKDLVICLPLFIFLMSVLFGWLFRSWSVSFFPVGISVYVIACALGFMGWIGIPVSSLFIVAIVLTLAITIASTAHVIYAYRESEHCVAASHFSERIKFVLKKVLLPFSLACASALFGFVLDIFSFVPVIQNVSYAFAICVLFSFFTVIFILPLLLSIIDAPRSKERKILVFLIHGFSNLNEILSAHSKKFIIALICVACVGVFSAKSMTIESLPYVFLKKSDPLLENMYFTSDHIAGQNAYQISIFSEEKNIFMQSTYMQKVLDIEKKIVNLTGTSYTYSASDMIATTYKIFMFNDKNFYRIPKDPRILNRFYAELSKQAFMSSLINKDYNKLTIYVTCNLYNTPLLSEYKHKLNALLKKETAGSPLQFKIKDFWSEFASIVTNLLILQIFSIITIYIICFVVVGFLFKSFKAGLVSVIPNVLPLCVIAAVQYFLNIPVSVTSVILYSIVVGLSIDETTHMFYTFKEEFLKLKNKELAVKAALKSQVVPVTISSTSIAVACLSMLTSQFVPVFQLAFLVGVGIFSAWFADLAITPFLLRNIGLVKEK